MATNKIVLTDITEASFTITLASLANGSSRQGTIISNSGDYPAALIFGKVMTGTTPTVNTLFEFYLIRSNGTYRDDKAGAADAAITIRNAFLLGTISVTADSDTSYEFVMDTAPLGALGPEWTIAVKNSTGSALNATGSNFDIDYRYYTPDVQAAA